MRIKYEATETAPNASAYDPPDERITREINAQDVSEALNAFNDFLRAVYGCLYQVDFVEPDDDAIS